MTTILISEPGEIIEAGKYLSVTTIIFPIEISLLNANKSQIFVCEKGILKQRTNITETQYASLNEQAATNVKPVSTQESDSKKNSSLEGILSSNQLPLFS